jgi:hypothetical protein
MGKPMIKHLITLAIVAILSLHGYSQNREKSSDKYFGVNLLKNPGAEQQSTGEQIPHWQASTHISQGSSMHARYGEISGEWEKGCNQRCGLPPKAGKAYFRLPVDGRNPHVSLSQTIDLTPIAQLINEYEITVRKGGYIAGTRCEKEGCTQGGLMETYYDTDGAYINAFGQNVDNASFPRRDGKRTGMHQFFDFYSTTTFIPENATRLVVSMEAGSSDCCSEATVFLDNLYLVLTKGKARSK